MRCGRPGGARGSSGLGPRALGRVRRRCCCCYSCCWEARALSTRATCAAGRGGESCRRFQRGPPEPGSEPSAASGRAGGACGVGRAMLAKFSDPRPSSEQKSWWHLGPSSENAHSPRAYHCTSGFPELHGLQLRFSQRLGFLILGKGLGLCSSRGAAVAWRARGPNETRIGCSTSPVFGATRQGRHLSAAKCSGIKPCARSVKVKPPLAAGRRVRVTPLSRPHQRRTFCCCFN